MTSAAVQRARSGTRTAHAEARIESYSRTQLLGAVSDLATLDCAPLELPDVIAEIHTKLARRIGAPVKLSHEDTKALNTTAAMLTQLQEHSSTSAPVRKYVRALQLWALKITCIDPTSTQTREHPMWDLIARLFEAGLGWRTPDQSLTTDKHYVAVAAAVAKIVRAPIDDLTVVLDAITSIDSVLHEQRQTSQSSLRRVATSRSAVHELLAGKLATMSAPQCIVDFLQGPWRRVLCRVGEEHGVPSLSWAAATDAVEHLLWSLADKSDDTERKHFRALVPKLIAALEEGLALIMYPHAAKDEFLVELEKLHFRALRGGGIQLHNANAASRAVFARFGSAIHVEEVTLASHDDSGNMAPAGRVSDKDNLHYACESMPVGTWIEWRESDGKSWRGQLAWMDGYFREATFVDRKGNVTADIRYDELATALRNGDAHVLDGGAVVSQLLSTKTA